MIMSFGDFFLQSNNGKKISLNFKGKLKREDFAGNQKLLKIFDYFDSDKSGVIENLTKDGKNEIANIFAHIKQTAELREGEGNTVLDSQEAISLTSFVKNLKGVTANELFEFLKIAEEKKNVVEKETVEVSSDGTKTVVSTLQDGSVETDVFYQSGELKLRVTETPITEDFTKGEKITTFDSEIVEKKGGNGKKEELSLVRGAKEGRIILKNDSAKYLSEKYNKEVASAYYKNGVMELRDKNDKPVMRVAVDISPKVEQELREFVGKHLKESSENVLQLAKTAGWIDKLGIDLQDISINKAKLALSILNPALLLTALEANGKEKLEEYLNQLRENVKNGELLESGATTQGAFDSRFERMTGHSEVNFLQIERLRQTADKYNNVQGLNQRIVLLNQGIKEVKQLYQNYRAQKQGVPNSGKLNSNFDGKILEILTQFFNGDEDVAKALIQTISKGITSKDDLFRKFNAVLTTIKQKASETKADLLKGESEEELKARYENEYKAMYGQDAVFKAEELITNGKETGGMIQIGMMTAAQMLLAAATMGTGNAALMALQSNALIGFLSTVGTDYALSLSNILSSERGFTAEAQEELHQRTLGTAEFIGFGMVAANPLSRAVGKYASKLFASDAEKVLEGAFAQEVKAGSQAVTRTTTGALTKTTLSLESALEWVVVKGAEFGTEILSFSGFELLQEDEEFKKVVGGQASTLTKLKVMNAALQVMLGSLVRNQALRGQSKLVVKECNKMLKDMGIEGGKLTENKRPGGSNYTLEINGETKTFKDIKELQANFMSVLAENFIKTRQIPEEIKKLDNEALVSEFTKLIQKQDALTESANARLVDLYQELQNRGLEVNKVVNEGVNEGVNGEVNLASQAYKSEITPEQIERLNIYGKNLGERIKEFILSDNPSPEIIDKRIAFVTENKTNGFVKMLLVYISQGATIKIIDQAEAVKEIQSNLESISIIGYVAGDFTQSITDISLLPRLLELSKKAAKDNDMAALKEMEYLVNKDKNHSVELSNESVEVDSQIILYMLSNCDYRGKINFDAEIGKLIEGEDMSHYTQCIKGILYQNPELADIALQFNSKMKNKSYQEVQLMYEELIKNGTLPRKLVFKKFKADEKPIDTMHQVLDYVYRNEHSKQTSLKDPRYTKPLTPYTEAGNKIHNLKSSKPEENPQLVAEIKADIEALRKTDPEKAQELQIVLEMFTNPTVVSEVTDAQIDAVVNYLNDHYSHLEGYLNEQVGEIGINDPKYGRFGHRIKGEASTHDKVANFIKDAIKEEQKAKEKGEEYTPKTLLSAFKDVRDKYACRTVFELGDFTKHPEVKVLIAQAKTLASEGKPELAAAKMHEAEFKAAELQSEPVRLQILEAMRRAKEEGKDLKAVRISNYYSENGIPIFTPEQMESLKLEAAQMGIDVEFIRLAKEIDPKATTEFVDGASTKKQPSGYTALQINFETKTGEVIEWQYRGELVNEFAEAEHLPYDLRTGKHPWAQYPELEALYKPIAELIDEHVMPKHAYKQLNKYFTDYYTHLRRLELGFESKEPKLSDYENYTDTDGIKRSYKFDKRLEAKNLMALHYYGEGIKDGTITQERAVEEFSRELIQAEQAGSVDKIKDETDTSILNNARYEMSRVVNRGKRVASYVSEKTKGFLKGSKKVVRGLSNLADFALMNVKLKRLGIKDSRSRFEIEEKLKNSNFESEEIRSQIINSIKTLKTMKVRDWEIDNMLFQLEKIENGERILDKTSLEIISEMEKLYQKTSSDWNEFTFCKLTLDSIEDGNNVEVLNKVKDLNLAVDRGYTLEDAEQNMRMGIRGEKNINLYEDILKSPVTASIVGGLGIEYTSREIFNTCKNSQKEVVPENWELLQQFSKELLEFAPYSRPFEIFKTLKNDDIEITKQNLKTFIDAYKADTRSVKIGSLGGCITKEGKLDLSMMGDAENAGRLGVDSKDLKNPDGTYNQNAIKYIQALRDAGFNDNISFNNIINLARSAAAKQKLEGEIYSKEVIDTAIELKEYGIKDDVISHIIKLATRKGIVDKELLELYKPFGMVLKTEDLYTLEQGIGDMLTYGNSEYRPQIVSQMIHLLKNGLSLHEIAMSNIFTHEGADGNIVTADVLKGLVQLKQNDFYAGNLQEVLDSCRKPDGSINQEILNTFVELKKQGFDEFYLKHIISTATNSKGELNKDNLNLTLQLMKEFKGSEFCRDKDEVYMTQLLMEICTDKSGNVDKKLLNECKNSLPDLFKMVAEEDKGSFRYILDRALTPDGKFDKHVIEKINELKNLDDNVRYPNEINIAGRFIDACKDSDGNFSIDMYNDGVMLVKKYGFTKHEVSYKLAPYEDFKSYKNKNNIYDLSLQGKRQLQSLLLRYNSNTSTLQGLKKMLKSDLLPSTDSEYAKIMKQLSQSLGQTDFVLNNIELNQMNTDIARLAKILVTNESAGEVKISTTYDELLKQIQSKMSGLSESEKLKIYDYFGFTVKDGKIIGFPSANGKSIENSDITNSFSKKVVEALTKMVNDYNKNTQITVEGNPELSRILTSLSQTMPEILNKFSNPVIAKQTIQTIQKISKTEDFVKLNEQDKIILIVATLLKDTNIGSLRESAYHIHTMSAKFSWNKTDREKLYSLLIVPERIEEYNNSNPDKVITRNIRHTTIKSNEREEAIDMFAFTIKDRSLDKMSYLLYADKISPELKTELKKRIYEIKKDDFILPQLSMDNLDKYVVEEEHNGHKVKVVHASRVPDLFVFIHTPEAGIINYASRTTKLSNFEEFSNIDNDAVICASYVSSSQFGAFRKHGLVFKVPTGHEYVGMSYDMTSLGKNTREMVAEYYRNKGLKAGQGKGMKYAHRTFVSMKLKDTLHITEHSYSELLKSRHELLAQLKEIKDTSSPEYQNIRNQIVKINKELKKIDDDYVARMDKVKERCTSEQISLSDIKDVDPTLAKAFEEFLSKTNQDYNTDALMRKDFWNEVLVNEMTVVGEYTVAIDKMPEEYLIKSETEGTYIIDFSR